MERRSNSSANSKREDESSDDGYIDDEASGDERLIIETIEIEEVGERVEILEVTNGCTTMNGQSEAMDEVSHYEEDEFDDDSADASQSAAATKRTGKGVKKIFRSKINPLDDDSGGCSIRRTTKKDCCQYKETDEYKNKLPRYNGLYSHYGLSKDELERRESKQLENCQLQFRRQSRQTEQKEFLAKTNEEAFAKW
jgi:hypothetical protein